MKKLLSAAIATAAALMISAAPSLAGDTVTTAVEITVPAVMEIAFSTDGLTAAAPLTDNAVTEAEFISGSKTWTTYATLYVDANCSYDVSVKAGGATFAGTGSGTKPVSELSIVASSGSGAQPAVSLSNVDQDIVDAATAGLDNPYPLDAEMTFAVDDTAGTYTTTLTYTVSAD